MSALASNTTDQRTAVRWRAAEDSRASRIPSLRSKGSARGALVFRGRRVVFESHLELMVAFVLLARPDVVDIWDQPPAVVYRSPDGTVHGHTFDYLIILADGRRIAVAVKTAKRADAKNLKGFLEAITPQIPKSFADGVLLITDKAFTRDAVHNAKLIFFMRRDRVLDPANAAADDDSVLAIAKTLSGAAAIGDIARAAGLDGRGFRAIVRLIGDGTLEVEDLGRITPRTRVRFAISQPEDL